jgi:hypothetical protein
MGAEEESASALAEVLQVIAGEILTLAALSEPEWDTFALSPCRPVALSPCRPVAEVTDFAAV